MSWSPAYSPGTGRALALTPQKLVLEKILKLFLKFRFFLQQQLLLMLLGIGPIISPGSVAQIFTLF